MDNILEKHKKEAETKEKNMKSASEELQLLFENQTDNTAPLDYIQVLTTKPSIVEKFNEI